MSNILSEFIVVYLSVLVGCVLLGTFARIFAINIGADEFTAGIVFWAVTLLGIIIYAVLALLIDGLYLATVRWFFPKKKQSKLPKEQSNNSEKLEQIEVAFFLKKVFPEVLNNVETETIKRHLKDDELKGVIKIRKNLSMQQ